MRKVRVEICNIQTKTVNYLHPSYFVRKVRVRNRKKEVTTVNHFRPNKSAKKVHARSSKNEIKSVNDFQFAKINNISAPKIQNLVNKS